MAGPLTGVRIIEMAGIGPGPFAAMMLVRHGGGGDPGGAGPETSGARRPGPRGGTSCSGAGATSRIDLKHPDGVAAMLRLVDKADALIEGFRPGVMERLGVGPDVCLARNPKLVFGRMTGWGQDGPYATSAGHDINYIALAGVPGPLRPSR